MELPLGDFCPEEPEAAREKTPEPGEKPWIWRYCKRGPEADHRSEDPRKDGMLFDCCCPPGCCLVGFGKPWSPGRNGDRPW